MSLKVSARAPGKLLLLGEYAVLDGGPAIVAALDRYATVDIGEQSRRDHVRIAAPQLGVELDACPDRLPPIDGPLRFVLATLGEMDVELRRVLLSGRRITITSELGDAPGNKPGLGSSAAVVAALTAAIWHLHRGRAAASPQERLALLRHALMAHRRAQGGSGSGADVAASVYGGVIKFEAHPPELPVVTAVLWPEALQLLVAWSGTSASTPQLIASYGALLNGHSRPRKEFVETSRCQVEHFISNSAAAAAAIAAAGCALEKLACDAHLPIFTPALRQLISIARSHGAAAKISGAGGGDCGIAVTDDCSAAERIRADWRNSGLLPLEVGIAQQGVTSATR